MLDLAYQNKETVIHRLDPRVKLLWLIVVSITLTTWNDPLCLLILWIVVLLYGRIADIPISQSLRNLVPVSPFIILILIANIAFWRPDHATSAHLIGYILPQRFLIIPPIPFYWETIFFSLGTLLRIVTLASSIFVMIQTIPPSELAIGIVRMGVPPEVGMALSMTLAYIPVVIEQLTSVMEAQQSRAWKVNTSNPIARFQAYIPITIPTFFRSFQAAESMAAAMMSRGFGYDIDHRTELNPGVLSGLDWTLIGVFTLFLTVGLIAGILGWTQYTLSMHLLGFH